MIKGADCGYLFLGLLVAISLCNSEGILHKTPSSKNKIIKTYEKHDTLLK
jgi:hypothetical protein